MKLVHAWISFGLVGVCLVASIAAGCSDDETSNNPAPDAGTDSPTSTPDTSTPDTSTGMDASVDPAVIARGKYIVENLGACGDCHTPRKPDGSLDQTKALSGVDCFVDAFPADNASGCLSSANLTNDATGLKNRTDAEIKTMLTTGKKPDGKFLSNVMPYYAIANMKPADLDATVAFLRTVSGISHTVQANQPPFANIAAASPPIDATKVPPAGAGANENGRYLATLICLECHTPEASIGQTSPIDMTKMFAGGRAYQLGLPSPPFPATIFSANITPHAASGISAWSAADIVKALKQGRDREDGGVCPPMPVGPMGAFGGMTDQDALDIANYIKGVPAIDNTVPNGCTAP